MACSIMTWRDTALGILTAVAIAAPLSISCEEDDGADSVSSEVAPEAVADAICSRYFACGCEMLDDGTQFTSVDACELAIAEDLQQAIDEGEAADLTYDGRCPALQSQLADTLACQSLDQVVLDTRLAAVVEDFERCKLFYGERGPGQTCERLEHSNGDNCERDLVCSDEDICITRRDSKAAGESCEDWGECEAGLACIDVDGGEDNSTCEVLPRGGDTCLGTINLCDIDFTCDIETKICVALPGPGSPCATMPNVLQWTCERGAVCDADTQTCIAAPGGGEPCETLCQEGFTCEDGRCAESPALICLADAGTNG